MQSECERTLVNGFSVIREYGSTLYVWLARAVPPTNTNFQLLPLQTKAGMPYTNTHKHRTSYFKSTLTFMGPAKSWKSLSAARQKRQILAIFNIHNNNKFQDLFSLSVNMRFLHVPYHPRSAAHKVYSYSPEISAFVTLITSTKVFSLNALTMPPKLSFT